MPEEMLKEHPGIDKVLKMSPVNLYSVTSKQQPIEERK